MKNKIQKLKEENDAIILAHNYQSPEVIDIADFVGDSFYLSRVAKEVKNKVIVFAGVYFMAESAKILCPEKTVLLPAKDAGCPLADMVDIEIFKKFKQEYKDFTFVCYINSNAEIKALCDVVVTSSNAVEIIKKIQNNKIVFLPDKNLGEFIKEKVLDKEIILWDGFCPTHQKISKEYILLMKEKIDNLIVLAHPECRKEVRDISNFIGSTKEIIDYAAKTNYKNYLIATECGVIYTLKKMHPNKNFYVPGITITCPNMKKTTINDIYESLLKMKYIIDVDDEVAEKARKPIVRMIELTR